MSLYSLKITMNLNKLLSSYCKLNNNTIYKDFYNFITSAEKPFSRDEKLGHITGSCWIIDKTCSKTLLTNHKKLNIWIHPGGHSEGETDPLDIAKREGVEETGLEIEPISSFPFYLDIHTIPRYKNTPAHYHYDFTYLFTPVSSMNYTVSTESHDLKWIDLHKIKNGDFENNIIYMANKTIDLRIINGRQK